MKPLLHIQSLKTYFFKKGGVLKAVDGLDLDIYPGETVALVGESGSGKTVTALSLVRLLPPTGRIVTGNIFFRGRDLLTLPEKQVAAIRGREIGFILQDPLSALNPVMCVGQQIAEVLRHHLSMGRKEAKEYSVNLMETVHLPNPGKLFSTYPHELSGGLRQRVLIAIALACRPALIIADEPTTALDVSIQGQILALLKELKEQFSISVLLITHDLSIVSQMADRVAVMYAGKIVEQASTRNLFTTPLHPYTEGLLHAVPRIDFSENGRTGQFTPLGGNVPDLMNLPSGCAFHPRCLLGDQLCKKKIPQDVFLNNGRTVKCLRREENHEKPARRIPAIPYTD